MDDLEVEQLIKQRNKEVYKLVKLRLVAGEMFKLLQDADLNTSEAYQPILHVLKIVKIADYLPLPGTHNDMLLGLKFTDEDFKLSYVQREVLRSKVMDKLRNYLRPKQLMAQKIREEFPYVFSNPTNQLEKDDEVTDESCPLSRMTVLQKKRCDLIESLMKLRYRKCQLLKEATEIKTGPCLRYEMEVRYAQARHTLVKTNVLHSYLVHHFLNTPVKTYKAIKLVEQDVNDAYEEMLAQGKIDPSMV